MSRTYEFWFNKGNAYNNFGESQEAIECYNEAIKSKPDYLSAHINKAIALYNLGKNVESIECSNEAIRLKPNSAIAFNNKGVAVYDLGRYLEAIECYNESIKFKPDYADAYNNKGNALKYLGKYFEAIECYNESIRLKPDYDLAYNNKGIALNILGKNIEAIECYNEAIKITPDLADLYNNKGCSLRDLGWNFEAIECYNEAIRLKPDYAEAYNYKGSAFYYLKRNSEAIECFNEAIKLKPDYAEAYHSKGCALIALGMRVEAIEFYDLAIKFKPEMAEAYNGKGYALCYLGQSPDAIKCYNKALKLQPDQPIYLCNRAKALNDLGKQSEALQDFNRADDIIQRTLASEISNAMPVQSKESLIFIKDKLKKERAELLQKIAKLQEGAVEYNEELKKIKNSFPELLNEVEEQEKLFKMQHSQIVASAVDCLDLNNNDSIKEILQKIHQIEKEVANYQKIMNEKIADLWAQKINRNEIEPYAFKVDDKIEGNSKLKKYYDALFDRLHNALKEAEIICSDGNIALDTKNCVYSAFSNAMKLTPIVGNLLSNSFSGVTNTIIKNNIKKNATKLISTLGMNPNIRENVIKKTAEAATLHNIDKIKTIKVNSEVHYWINKGIIAKCKDFFILDIKNQLYRHKPEILGCIDALKILYVIQNLEFPRELNPDEVINKLALAPSSYKFSKSKIVNANSDKKACCTIF